MRIRGEHHQRSGRCLRLYHRHDRRALPGYQPAWSSADYQHNRSLERSIRQRCTRMAGRNGAQRHDYNRQRHLHDRGGSCSFTLSAAHRSPVVYTVTCSGIDTNGFPANKVHSYDVRFATSRAGGFWQPPVDHPFANTTFNVVLPYVQAPLPPPPPPPPPPDGRGDSSHD